MSVFFFLNCEFEFTFGPFQILFPCCLLNVLSLLSGTLPWAFPFTYYFVLFINHFNRVFSSDLWLPRKPWTLLCCCFDSITGIWITNDGTGKSYLQERQEEMNTPSFCIKFCIRLKMITIWSVDMLKLCIENIIILYIIFIYNLKMHCFVSLFLLTSMLNLYLFICVNVCWKHQIEFINFQLRFE